MNKSLASRVDEIEERLETVQPVVGSLKEDVQVARRQMEGVGVEEEGDIRRRRSRKESPH